MNRYQKVQYSNKSIADKKLIFFVQLYGKIKIRMVNFEAFDGFTQHVGAVFILHHQPVTILPPQRLEPVQWLLSLRLLQYSLMF